jgi:hypothetical protein
MVALEEIVSLRLRYSALKTLDLKPLDKEQVQCLGLPEVPEWAAPYDPPDLKVIRSFEWLDPFRAKGFFDDVVVILPGTGGDVPELIWVRLERYLEDTGRFRGILLNEPFRDYGIHRHDPIGVRPLEVHDGMRLVAVPWKETGEKRP